MLFVNKTKEQIREKFNINPIANKSKLQGLQNVYIGGKKKVEKNNKNDIDELYNDEKYNLDDEMNLPVDSEISRFLPDLNTLTGYNYEKQQLDYEINFDLLKGYPKEIKGVKFVIYTINTSSVIPFLLFLFYKKNTKNEEIFTLPEISINVIDKLDDNDFKKKSIKSISEYVISKIFENFSQTDKPYYMGYKLYDNEYYLFFEYNLNNNHNIDDNVAVKFKRHDKLIWTTVSEIIDDKKILNFDIHDKSCKFFINNPDIITVYKDGGVLKHEIPTALYYGGHRTITNYVAVFGVSRRSTYASLGPYYYFANYENAMRYAIFSANNKPVQIDGKYITIDDHGRFDKGGLVRFVVFIGKMKLYDDKGHPNVIHKINIKKEPETSWVDDYNSAFTGLYEITNKENTNDGIIYTQAKYVVKQYNQQVPLSYHYVNTNVEITNNDYSRIFIE